MSCRPSRPRLATNRFLLRFWTLRFQSLAFSPASMRSRTSARAQGAQGMAITKPAGTWTYDDLLALPDDGKRYEIIMGELFELPSPGFAHATVIANLITMLIP